MQEDWGDQEHEDYVDINGGPYVETWVNLTQREVSQSILERGIDGFPETRRLRILVGQPITAAPAKAPDAKWSKESIKILIDVMLEQRATNPACVGIWSLQHLTI